MKFPGDQTVSIFTLSVAGPFNFIFNLVQMSSSAQPVKLQNLRLWSDIPEKRGCENVSVDRWSLNHTAALLFWSQTLMSAQI